MSQLCYCKRSSLLLLLQRVRLLHLLVSGPVLSSAAAWPSLWLAHSLMPGKLQFHYSCKKERSKNWLLKWDTVIPWNGIYLWLLGQPRLGTHFSLNRFHPVVLASYRSTVQELIDYFLPSHLHLLFSMSRSIPPAIPSDTAVICIWF